MYVGTLSIEFGDNVVHFNILHAMKFPAEDHSVFRLDILDDIVDEYVVAFDSLDDKEHYFLSFVHTCIEFEFEIEYESMIDMNFDIDDCDDVSIVDIDNEYD